MANGIFLRNGDELIAMSESEYEAEAVLQTLLADFPELMVGSSSSTGTNYLLIDREMSVSTGARNSSLWSMDHVFVDGRGIPTIVEVKRSSDSRIRREVVGQMLDYAANATIHWRTNTLKSRFEERCRAGEVDPDVVLREHLQEVEDAREFWSTVETNIAAGRLRLVFVADSVPLELQRVVEFLNSQMELTEVIAIEVKQFQDESGTHQTLVPKVLGRSEINASRKASAAGKVWDRRSVLEATAERSGAESLKAAEKLFDWAESRPELSQWFGSGKIDGSLGIGQESPAYLYPFVMYSYGKVEIMFQSLKNQPSFEAVEKREELRERLNAIDGVDLAADRIDARPSFPLEVLSNEESFRKFIETIDWAFAEAREYPR